MGISYEENAQSIAVILGDGDIMQAPGTAHSVREGEKPQRLYTWNMQMTKAPVGVGKEIPDDLELADAPAITIGFRSAEDARIFAKRMMELADWIEELSNEVVS